MSASLSQMARFPEFYYMSTLMEVCQDVEIREDEPETWEKAAESFLPPNVEQLFHKQADEAGRFRAAEGQQAKVDLLGSRDGLTHEN